MAKAHFMDTNKRVLNLLDTIGRRTSQTPSSPESIVRELNMGGRRDRLVPVDAEEPLATPALGAELLTPRELQIVVLVASGKVNKQIADVLSISEWTVSTHLRRIFAKLGVDTRAAMVSRCFGPIVEPPGL